MIINIGRQLGSGGREIGEQLAQQLQIPFYDKELIRLAAEESGISMESFEQADERRFHLFGISVPFCIPEPYAYGLTNDALFQIQSDVIRHLAEKESCLFVGRCTDYILRERTDCINIFIAAHEEDRITRVQQHHPSFTHEQAFEHMERMDKRRAAYYNFYTDKPWGMAASYHLCTN